MGEAAFLGLAPCVLSGHQPPAEADAEGVGEGGADVACAALEDVDADAVGGVAALLGLAALKGL